MNRPIQFKLLLPPDVKAWLETSARSNMRSQGAQVVACLRVQMETMKAAGEDLGGHAPAAATDRKTNHRGTHDHAGE